MPVPGPNSARRAVGGLSVRARGRDGLVSGLGLVRRILLVTWSVCRASPDGRSALPDYELACGSAGPLRPRIVALPYEPMSFSASSAASTDSLDARTER
jgi:hypothetical protein